MSSLLSLIAENKSLLAEVIENGGELPDDLAAKIFASEKSIQEKADNYAVFIDQLKAEIEFFKDKAKEFRAVAKSLENLDANIKERMKYAMEELGKDEIIGDVYRFKLSSAQPRLELDESKIPADFKKTTVTIEADKDSIKQALKSGHNVEGACLVESKSLRKYLVRKS